jgi:hypothetical protein
MAMPWVETASALTSAKTVVIDQQNGLQIVAYQPFVTWTDANNSNMQARVQNADGKLVFYTQSALSAGVPTVVFNSLVAPAGKPVPSAVEIHAQDGVQTVGYQPFLTLTDANAGYAMARVQNADGKLVFYTQSALNVGAPTVVFNTLTAPAGQPPPSAVEIHAQDGVQTVGYQPFLTLTDANAAFAKARLQNANGSLVFYSQGGMNRQSPEIVVDSASGDVHMTGTLKVDKDIQITGADCAERFEVADAEELQAGTVVVLDGDGRLSVSRDAYDRRVAGVIAGAGDFKPGIIMDAGPSDRTGAPVALVGKTFCKVDASFATVEVGDLLTASSTPGHAMKATDPVRAFGAVIGKALRPLRAGTGLIPILVTLQ